MLLNCCNLLESSFLKTIRESKMKNKLKHPNKRVKQTTTKQYFALIACTALPLIFLLNQCRTAPERSQITSFKTDNHYPLIISDRGDTIASQLNDLDGDNKWDELFFVVDLPANGVGTYSLQWVNEEPQYVVRTSA